jgi:simple sugar transport system permease protein
MLTHSAGVPLAAPQWSKMIFGQLLGGSYQVIILWWLFLAAIYHFVMRYTHFGNWIFAMGGDEDSARNAGIPTRRMTIALFVLSATSASFVGMCGAILFNSAQVSGGMNYIFNVIVSVVVGGVLLTGGFGSVIGIFFGTLTFAVVNQGIYFTNIDRNWSSLIIGIMLLVAVLMNNIFRKMALTYSPRKKEVRIAQ